MNSTKAPLTADQRHVITTRAFNRIGAKPPMPRPDEFCPCNQHLRQSGSKYCSSCAAAIAAVDVEQQSPLENAIYAFVAVAVIVLIFVLVYATTPATKADEHIDQRIRSQKQ